MAYIVDIEDIIKNYELKNNEGFLYCLFEAVSNALYCSVDNEDIKISIKFTREYKANEILKDSENCIKSFEIKDNGTGFTDKNFELFARRFYKTNHDCGKGLGRIAFIKVFDTVNINSYFKENNKIFNRKFIFDTSQIQDNKKEITKQHNIETTISFTNIKPIYQKNTLSKDIEYYYKEIINHFYIFLYYLIENNKTFEIKLTDDSGKISERIINTEKLKQDSIKKEEFTIENKNNLEGIDNKIKFEILHIKTKNVAENKALYVVDERAAGEINNLNLPPYLLEDKKGNNYYYNVYLKSPYFNRFLNESRTKLSLPTNTNNYTNSFITVEQIEKLLKERTDKFLNYEIKILEGKNEERIKKVLSDNNNNKIANNKAYLYMLSDKKIKGELLSKIKYKSTDKDVILKIKDFHEELQLRTVEKINKLLEDIKSTKEENFFNEIQMQISELINKVNIENSVNLSSYIMYRKYVLNLFNKALELYKSTTKQNEELFHNLLLPKHKVNNMDSNLWLLDDFFLYFDGSSEVSIKDIKINGKNIIRDLNEEEEKMLNEFNKKRLDKRLDLLFFPEEGKCVIIELKAPSVGVKDNIQQMDKYAELLANFISSNFTINQFYTYLLTDNFNKYDKPNGYRKIYGINGFVRDSNNIKDYDTDITIANQYSEVIRYTDLYERAKKRNKIFFSKLNIN